MKKFNEIKNDFAKAGELSTKIIVIAISFVAWLLFSAHETRINSLSARVSTIVESRFTAQDGEVLEHKLKAVEGEIKGSVQRAWERINENESHRDDRDAKIHDRIDALYKMLLDKKGEQK